MTTGFWAHNHLMMNTTHCECRGQLPVSFQEIDSGILTSDFGRLAERQKAGRMQNVTFQLEKES